MAVNLSNQQAPEPSADGDPMGTPTEQETVLWQGKPDTAILARKAFHTRKVSLYFAVLIAASLAFGNVQAAIVCTVLGLTALLILQGLAWLSVRTTLYILTDMRLIIRKGMAIETRINIPLKQVSAAHLHMQGKDRGDIAMELHGDRLLGIMLLWPHVRPWKINRPQPMLRAVPDAQNVARMLSDACAAINPIEQNLTAINEPSVQSGQKKNVPPARPEKGSVQRGPDRGFEGAPA
ncbi:photosynthetic complex putative assembly protein PuhB [Erythrobacter sp. MTPC3]|uniref:photosynthetic complex putative assembly protein PuhB n=1 Tax=Erythrobacter sp. MTPC3 TaxID=3056564 RepID=UPI0036F2DD2F